GAGDESNSCATLEETAALVEAPASTHEEAPRTPVRSATTKKRKLEGTYYGYPTFDGLVLYEGDDDEAYCHSRASADFILHALATPSKQNEEYNKEIKKHYMRHRAVHDVEYLRLFHPESDPSLLQMPTDSRSQSRQQRDLRAERAAATGHAPAPRPRNPNRLDTNASVPGATFPLLPLAQLPSVAAQSSQQTISSLTEGNVGMFMATLDSRAVFNLLQEAQELTCDMNEEQLAENALVRVAGLHSMLVSSFKSNNGPASVMDSFIDKIVEQYPNKLMKLGTSYADRLNQRPYQQVTYPRQVFEPGHIILPITTTNKLAGEMVEAHGIARLWGLGRGVNDRAEGEGSHGDWDHRLARQGGVYIRFVQEHITTYEQYKAEMLAARAARESRPAEEIGVFHNAVTGEAHSTRNLGQGRVGGAGSDSFIARSIVQFVREGTLSLEDVADVLLRSGAKTRFARLVKERQLEFPNISRRFDRIKELLMPMFPEINSDNYIVLISTAVVVLDPAGSVTWAAFEGAQDQGGAGEAARVLFGEASGTNVSRIQVAINGNGAIYQFYTTRNGGSGDIIAHVRRPQLGDTAGITEAGQSNLPYALDGTANPLAPSRAHALPPNGVVITAPNGTEIWAGLASANQAARVIFGRSTSSKFKMRVLRALNGNGVIYQFYSNA
ncbi:hypothetical protein ACHAXT_012098, partial [Thalassiosira profunda]